MSITIKTNNHPRDLVTWHELPAGVAEDWFSYITDEDEKFSCRFVEYRGSWYDTSETEGVAPSDIPGKWDSYLTDSFFSGVVFRFVDDNGNERVVVGTFYA
jgi:hypothetical protein